MEEKGETFEISVDVKNNGKETAKHTVQIYFQSPYGDYEKTNQVEKSAVELCGFDKKEIRGGATETYTITVNKEDLTSYDHIKAKTYILSEGDYYFTVGTDAHNAVNNILMVKKAAGITVDESKMSGTGNASLAYKWNKAEIDTESIPYKVFGNGQQNNQPVRRSRPQQIRGNERTEDNLSYP